MNFKLIYLGLLSFATLMSLTPSFTPSASACATVDATTQVAIHPEGTTADQQNNTAMEADPNCFNNNAINTTTQVQMAPGDIQQTHEGQQFVGGGDQNNTGLTTPHIPVGVNTQVDVEVPKETFGVGQ
jgi:hypothetical protein